MTSAKQRVNTNRAHLAIGDRVWVRRASRWDATSAELPRRVYIWNCWKWTDIEPAPCTRRSYGAPLV